MIGPINGNDSVYPQSLLDMWVKDLNGQQKSDADAQANRIFLAWKKRQPTSR